MKKMKIYSAFIFCALIMFGCASQRIADKDTQQWRYEIEPVGVGAQGSYQIKVWSYSRNVDVATEQTKKNAVHGIIFKGFAGKPGIAGQKPLVTNPSLDTEREDYFKPFFAEGGKYMKFVILANNGAIAAGDRIKIGKEYKVGVVVSVNVAELRKELESAGIIQKLGSSIF